ncbi:MAG: helix-turn-helix domain-containing protein [Clostridia bacterium]|nr:helix-turn-helix domain-containing protein [Clostridia bacterium]
MSIGANIRRLRESHRLTQKELGEIAGVSDKAVSTWEKGIKLPRMGAVERLAAYFGVPKSAILDDAVPEGNPFAKQLDRLCAAWDRSPQTIERELDMPQGRLAMLRDGSALPFEGELHRLQQYFEMNAPTVSERPNVIPLVRPGTTRRIPVLGRVPAGIPVEAITDVVDEIELDGRMAGDGYDYFALLVTGDSMYPEYRDGDVVIVRMQPTAETGDDVVAYVGGGDATLKRLTLTTVGLQLRPLNPAYPVRAFTHDQVAAGQVTIAGVVVEQRRVRHR